MKVQETALAISHGHDECFSYIDLCEEFLHLSGYCLMVAIFFWSFVLAVGEQENANASQVGLVVPMLMNMIFCWI